jgi:Zn-dependent protease
MRLLAPRIGRVRGIDVHVDVSALAIVALIAWVLAGDALPTLAPGYASGEYWLAGILTSVLFLAGLLAHELSHSLVALRRGIRVRGITLWLLGGIATIEDEPVNPRDDLAIAVAGPLASTAIAFCALAIAAVADGLGAAPLFAATAAWLGSINLLLAVFNLVPAAPLDGGRVLRAWLWRRHGDRARAARTAARAGEMFAYLLVALGILELLLGAGVSGVWAILLGWFLLGAARAEKERVEVEQQLAGVRVKDVMTPDPVTAPASITVDELLECYVARHRCTSVPLVAEDGRLVGLATLARCRAVNPRRRAGGSVMDIAWPLSEVTTAQRDELLNKVLHHVSGGDGRILVFDGSQLAGIISPSDVARAVEIVRGAAARRDDSEPWTHEDGRSVA